MATFRVPQTIEPFDLNYINNMVRVPTAQGVAARVSLTLVGGALGSAVVSVRRTQGGTPIDFSTPVTLTTGTLTALIEADEMRGVDELVLEVTTAAGAAGYARLDVVQDEDR